MAMHSEEYSYHYGRAYMSFEEYEREMAKPIPDMADPHCETLEELNEWAKEHGCDNIIFHCNYARIMSKNEVK